MKQSIGIEAEKKLVSKFFGITTVCKNFVVALSLKIDRFQRAGYVICVLVLTGSRSDIEVLFTHGILMHQDAVRMSIYNNPK